MIKQSLTWISEVRDSCAPPKTGGEDNPRIWLVLVTVIVLTVFYYWTRADTIGICSSHRPWFKMTGTTFSPLVHGLVSGGLLGLVPLGFASVFFPRNGMAWGLGGGNIRFGLIWLAIGLPVGILAGWVASSNPDMQAVYPLDAQLTTNPRVFLTHSLGQLCYITGWEILFRSVLLRDLTRSIGFANANMIQTALSTVAHFGRPFTETLAAIPAGLAFGGVARKTGSVWYVIFIHWSVGVAQDWFILTR